jgi:C-terminal processing protease CtpA/Prc
MLKTNWLWSLVLIISSDFLPRGRCFHLPSRHSPGGLVSTRLEMHAGRQDDMWKRLSKPLTAAIIMLSITVQGVQGADEVLSPLASGQSIMAPTATMTPRVNKYWSRMGEDSDEERREANEALLDYAVGTINTQFYDNSGGAFFQPRDFYSRWMLLRDIAMGKLQLTSPKSSTGNNIPKLKLETREGAVEALKWLVSNLHDPYSHYLTRDELLQELLPSGKQDGFLGLGAMVEAPTAPLSQALSGTKGLLSPRRAANLPVISAVVPNSPAERAGLTVGDRIVAVGKHEFLGYTRDRVERILKHKFNADNYVGFPSLTIAKPVWKTICLKQRRMKVVIGYRTSRVRLPTASVEPFHPAHGNNIVHYEMLTPENSILDRLNSKVGYIRLTRFSRASTAAYVQAIQDLESMGAESYIIDLRNNYGGIIQEAMLTASTLLRDPHAVLCFTMNSRGGFTPHDAEEYVVDSRYPGYLLSKTESPQATLDQVRRESREMVEHWSPPSSFVSLHEHSMKRGIHASNIATAMINQQIWNSQKKLVLLINEGTASSAEVFASSLHDNGRTVALVGTKTYGKGLIQHTFPMPDQGGLRLTVAEYLTPSLHHVTNVGSARFDSQTGAWVGGGIQPDVVCDSQQGIPSKVGADLCVGMALDALEEAKNEIKSDGVFDPTLMHRVGVTKHAMRAGVVYDY